MFRRVRFPPQLVRSGSDDADAGLPLRDYDGVSAVPEGWEMRVQHKPGKKAKPYYVNLSTGEASFTLPSSFGHSKTAPSFTQADIAYTNSDYAKFLRDSLADPDRPVPSKGTGKMSIEEANSNWEVTEIDDTEDTDTKRVTLCDGNTCMYILLGAAAITKLMGMWGKKKRSQRKRSQRKHYI